MPERIPQSATIRVALRAYLSTDHLSAATGKTIPVTISKNGAAFGNPSAGATNATEIASGWYYVDMSTTDTGTVGPLIILGTLAGVDPIETSYDVAAFQTFPTNFTSLVIDGSGRVDVGKVTGTAQTARDLGNALPTAAAGASGGLPTLDANLSVLANIALRGTASAGASGSITLVGGSSTDNFYRYQWVRIVSGTGAGQTRLIAQYIGSTGVATTAKAWLVTPDNTSVFVIHPDAEASIITSGLAQAGGATTITLSTAASAVDNSHRYQVIAIVGGTGSGQSNLILSYVGATKVATLAETWTTTPDATSVYQIMVVGRAAVDAILAGLDFNATMKTSLNAATPASVQNIAAQTGDSFARLGAPSGASIDADILTRSTYAGGDTSGTTTLLSRIASALSISGGAVTVGTNNDKTGYTLTNGEHTSIATDAQTGLTAQGYTTTRAGFLDTLNGLVAAVVNGTLDVAASAHNLANSIGAKINSGGGGAGTDPLLNVVPGAYGVGTAGYDIGQIPGLQARLGGNSPINVTSLVVNGALAPLYLEDDYYNVDGRAIYIPYSGPALASVALYIGRLPAPALLTVAGVVTAANVYYIEFSHTTLAAKLREGGYDYSIVGTEANGHTFTIAAGKVPIKRRQA